MEKIAVCSRSDSRVSGHAGQSRNWLLYDVSDNEVCKVTRIELAKKQTFHHFKGDDAHPLDGITALLAASSGESFARRLRKAGVDVQLTAEPDANKAVADFLNKRLAPPKPRPIGALFCKLRDTFSEH